LLEIFSHQGAPISTERAKIFQLFIFAIGIRTTLLQGDIIVKPCGRRHLLFASNQQLELLTRALQWYMDATFWVVKKPFTHTTVYGARVYAPNKYVVQNGFWSVQNYHFHQLSKGA